MDVKEALTAGRKVLMDNEWIQRRSHKEVDGKHYFCAGGAQTEALCPGYYTVGEGGEAPIDARLEDEVFGILNRATRIIDPTAANYVHYNDSRANSKADVIKLFDKALELV